MNKHTGISKLLKEHDKNWTVGAVKQSAQSADATCLYSTKMMLKMINPSAQSTPCFLLRYEKL